MEIFAGLCVCSLILSAAFVATRILILWRRTRGRPELLLGVMLGCTTVLGYPLAIASNRLAADEFWTVHVGAVLCMNVGFGCLLLFTLTVFRPKSRRAMGFAGLLMSALCATTVSTAIVMGGENPPGTAERNSLNILLSTPIVISYGWTMLEALSYHRRLSLQLRLGLTSSLVVNRVLLWGLMAMSAGSATLVTIIVMALGIDFARTPALVAVLSGLGLAQATRNEAGAFELETLEWRFCFPIDPLQSPISESNIGPI